MTSLVRWRDLQKLADYACREFDLRPKRIEPMTDPRDTRLGWCDSNGVIKLRVHVHGQPNKALRWSTIVTTLSHELAHTDEDGWRHGESHRELDDLIREAWRKNKRTAKLLKG